MRFPGRVLAVLVFAVPSLSASMIYSTRADWLAAVNVVSTANFDGIAANTMVNYHHANGYQAPPITVVGYGEGIWYLRNVYYTSAASAYNWGTGAVLESANNLGNTRLRVTVTGSPTAFGLNLMTVGYGNPVGISINGGAEMTVATSSNKALPTFWGVTHDSAISTIDIRPATLNTFVLIDNVSTAMAIAAGVPDPPPGAETPETSTVLLAASGLVLIGVGRRTRNRSSAGQNR